MSTLNVQDYGATGDGSTDDRPAIQAAIDDAAQGDTVYFPEPTDSYWIEQSGTYGEAVIMVDGDVHADDLTLAGEGANTVVKMAGGQSSSYRMLRILHPNNLTFTVRDLVWDGNKANQSTESATCIGFRSTGASGTGTMLLQDVVARNSASTGIMVQYGGVELNRVTVHDNYGHGIGVNISSQYDPAPYFHNIHAYNNAGKSSYYAVDFSAGTGILEDAVVENSVNGGGTKLGSQGQKDFTYRRVRIQNHPKHAFQNTGNGENAECSFEDVIFADCGLNVRLNNDANYTMTGEFVATNIVDSRGGIHLHQSGSLDASSATVYSNRTTDGGAGLNSTTSATGNVIDTYHATRNEGGATNNESNLQIDTEGSDDKTDIASVPTAGEVGAWSDGGSTETDEETAESSSEAFDSWTPRWDSTTDDWAIVSGTEFDGDSALEFHYDGTQQTRYGLSWDPVGQPSDVEVLDKFRIPSFPDDTNSGYLARLYLRSSTSNGGEDGYWLEAEAPQDGFRLGKYTDGNLTTMKRFGTLAENTFFYRRFRATGESIKAKVWQVDDVEPTDWDVEMTDADHADGWVGLGSWDPDAVETDVLSVGTEGQSAPGPAFDETPSITWVEPAHGDEVNGDQSVQIDAADDEDDEGTLQVAYRVDDGTWKTADYDPESGSYEDVWDTTTTADGDHTLEARAIDSSENASSTEIVVTVTSESDEETSGLDIDRFDVTDNSNPAWTWYDIDWSVSDSNGTLDTVVSELLYSGATVAAESTSVTGETASFSHELRVRGDVDEIRLSVNDTDNNVVSTTKQV